MAELAVEAREARAREIVEKYAWGNAAVGLIPIPLLDLVAITGVQVKMVHSLAELYESPFREEAVRATVIAFFTGLGTFTVAGGLFFSVVKLVPLFGMTAAVLSLPAMAGAFTYAVGRIYVLHLEAGGTIMSMDPVQMRAHFEQLYKEGLQIVKRSETAPVVVSRKKAEVEAPTQS